MHVWRVSLNGFVLNNVVFTHWKEGSTSCSISVQTKSNFADRLHGKRNHESQFSVLLFPVCSILGFCIYNSEKYRGMHSSRCLVTYWVHKCKINTVTITGYRIGIN